MLSHAMAESHEKSRSRYAPSSFAPRARATASGPAAAKGPARFAFGTIRVHADDAGPAPAKCGCGSSGGAVACGGCEEKKRAGDPQKAVGVVDEEEAAQENPRPRAGGAATIQCNGAGDYEVVLGSYATATCGTKDCVVQHESSHIADWRGRWPDGCKDQAKGYLPVGGPGYAAFLRTSECTAHTIDLQCAEALPKEGSCKTTVEDYIKLTKDQKANYC